MTILLAWRIPMPNQINRITIPLNIPAEAYKVLLKLQKNLHLDISAIVENWFWEEYLKDNFDSLLDYYPSLILEFQKAKKLSQHYTRLLLFIPTIELPLPLSKLLLLIILKHTYPYLKNKKEEVEHA